MAAESQAETLKSQRQARHSWITIRMDPPWVKMKTEAALLKLEIRRVRCNSTGVSWGTFWRASEQREEMQEEDQREWQRTRKYWRKERGSIEEAQVHVWIRKWPSSFFLRNIPRHLHLNVVYNSILWTLWLVNQFVEINGKCVHRNSCTISLPETWAEFSISIIG